jgi:GT2 family glycosyltransferase
MLDRLLYSITNNSYKKIEIIIVNDFSNDDTEQIVRQFKDKNKNTNIKLINNNKNLNVTACRNLGLKSASGRYILLIDDDNVLDKDCILHLKQVLDNKLDVGMVGPMMYYFSDKSKLWWAGTKRNMTTSRTYFIGKHFPIPKEATWETDDFPNAWMFRNDIIKNKIFFDESFVIHYEEGDFANRVKSQLNFKLLVVKSALIYHDVPINDNAGQARRWLDHTRVYYTARNRIVFHRKYSTLAQFLCFILFWNWLFTVFYIYYILRIPNHKFTGKLVSALVYLKGSLSFYK